MWSTPQTVWPEQDSILASKDIAPKEASGQNHRGVQHHAWSRDFCEGQYSVRPVLGSQLLPYAELEPFCLILQVSSSTGPPTPFFVSAKVGPVVQGDQIGKEGALQIATRWDVGEWVWGIESAPLRRMAQASPIGTVGFRFEIWRHGQLSRRWLGCTTPAAIPSGTFKVSMGGVQLSVAAHRGLRAEVAMRQEGAHVTDGGAASATDAVSSAASLEYEAMQAAAEGRWGAVTALLRELRPAVAENSSQGLAEQDSSGRTLLRLCVDGQHRDRIAALQALEGGILTAVLGSRRPYLWTLQLMAVCGRSGTFIGETRVAVPRSAGVFCGRPWTVPSKTTVPWQDLIWSDSQHCQGELQSVASDTRLIQLSSDSVTLCLRPAAPGEDVLLGGSSFRNPHGFALVSASGSVAGRPALGIFDFQASARLAVELEKHGPQEAAALAVACDADPRALAEDGLSPFTAALLGDDPCNLLASVRPPLRIRLRRGDSEAWVSLARSADGAGHADLVAAPLCRGIALPDEMAKALLDFCFRADLPLLAARALGRVNGEKYLLDAAERAEDPHWLRVTETITQQIHPDRPLRLEEGIVEYVLNQIRLHRSQFKLVLAAYLTGCAQTDIRDPPAVLFDGGAECPICFDTLCWGAPVCLVDGKCAVCPHFLCTGCARGCEAAASSSGASLRCPECRRSASRVAPLPSLVEDPLGWFDCLAMPNGRMRRETFQRAVAATLPVDADELGMALDSQQLLKTPLSTEVTAAEFFSGGLYAWLLRHEAEHRLSTGMGVPPPIELREDWFRHWDLSKSGRLSRRDLTRAVLRTLRVSSINFDRVKELRHCVDRLWERHAAMRRNVGGHCSSQDISCTEFLQENGLGEMLEDEFGAEFTAAAAVAVATSTRRPRQDRQRLDRRTVVAQVADRLTSAALAPLQNHAARPGRFRGSGIPAQVLLPQPSGLSLPSVSEDSQDEAEDLDRSPSPESSVYSDSQVVHL
mmetsp:Transcript_29616/g.64406  ORF Transcript_29616/g.64406 Transcript_29616/m.64406 type:complete len:982 (+) Transcript_29616:104-3049(+)